MAAGSHARSTPWQPVQVAAMVLAVVFAVIGVLGFIPGATTKYDRLAATGPESGALLFGVFQVSVLHNVLHMVFGGVGLAAAPSVAGARTFLLGGGTIYLLLWGYGLFVDYDSSANFMPQDTADHWLHLGLALLMLVLGVVLSGLSSRTSATPQAKPRIGPDAP